MNLTLTLLAARFALYFFAVRGYICRAFCKMVFLYCRIVGGVVHLFQHWIDEKLIDCNANIESGIGLRKQDLLNKLTASKSRRMSDVRLWSPAGRSRVKFIAFLYVVKAQLAFFGAGVGVMKLSIRSLEGATALSDSEIRSFERNMESLNTIFSKPPSPIAGLELMLWMVTSSAYVNDTLGDFRETYENKLCKRGHDEAISWARAQVVRDVKNRVLGPIKIAGWASTIFHWLKRMVHRH